MNKVGRLFAATMLAFGSLFWYTPAHATTLEEAQADLAIAQQALADAQAAVDSASAEVLAFAPSYSDAVSLSDAAEQAYLDTAISGSVTETFANGAMQTSVQVLLDGSTPITSAGNPRLATGNLTSNIQDGYIYVNEYPANFTIVSPRPATGVSFYTYARNGNQTITVNFTDDTTGSFINYNGVGNSACPSYECFITYTAPEGKSFDSIYFPSDFDIFMIDNVTFQTDTYDAALYQEYLDSQESLAIAQAQKDALDLNLANAIAAYDAALAEVQRLEQLVIDLTPAEPDWWQVQWNEGQEVRISIVDEGYAFDTIQAWYGDPNDESCGVDVTQTLSPIIIGNSSASFVVNNELFTDPCPGIVKVLRFAATIAPVSVEPSPEPTSSPTVSPEPTPEPSPESTDSPTVSPEPTPTEEPSPEETSPPAPEQTPSPEPSPTSPPPVVEPPVEPSPEPTQEPAPTPEPEPQPEPQPEPEPVVPEQVEPSEEPEPVVSDTPSPHPTPSPSETSKPVVQETKAPTPTPSPTITPSPTPSPTPTIIPEPTPVEPEKPTVEEKINIVLTEIEDVSEITEEQKELILEQKEELIEATNEVFANADPGSEEYEEALAVLALIAEADDVELPEELTAIPLVGDVAGAVLEVFNDIGNVGADMSPQVRETSEKVVVASVIVANIAITATSAATSAAAVATRRP